MRWPLELPAGTQNAVGSQTPPTHFREPVMLGSAASEAIASVLAQWGTQARLYTLSAPNPEQPLPADLLVESFVLQDALSAPFTLYINALVCHAAVELKQLYARPIALHTTLADGRRSRRSGYVVQADALDADGGFARKGLWVRPWIALLAHTLRSRVWQDRSLIEIVDEVFAGHAAIAAWRWDVGVLRHVSQGMFARQAGRRTYCVQYRESDLDFVARLLAEEGLSWRIEEDDHAPGGHTMVIFADSADQPQDPTSASGLGGAGVRLHRSSSQEEQDTLQSLAEGRSLGPTATVVQGWDVHTNRAVTAEVPSPQRWGGETVASVHTWLSSYDPTGDHLFGNPTDAQFTARCLQEAHEARCKTWRGHGTVRTLRPGTWMAVTQTGADQPLGLAEAPEALALFVTHTQACGVNNLPKDLSATIVAAMGTAMLPAWGPDGVMGAVDGSGVAPADVPSAIDTEAMRQQAARSGHACHFQAVRREVPWRTVLMDGTGQRPRPRPTALGPQTAIVVGPDGHTVPQGAHELHTDAMGRVKVRFHWQDEGVSGEHSCWLRVVQRFAGPGMGEQFLPRIGHEVLVGFLNNDMDQPYVQASLYNGQGDDDARTSTDHRPSGQANRVASGSGGHSPAWHGAAPGVASEGTAGQNNAAALSGFKSKEFGGAGFNQLVFDDTDQQSRLHLHSTQAQTWLQMGHLLHQADNHRGSFRGLGFELRTDAWGAVRGAQGLLLSTFPLSSPSHSHRRGALDQPAKVAHDDQPGLALREQCQQLVASCHQATATHHTVGLRSAATDAPGAKPAADVSLVGQAGVGITAAQDLHLSSEAPLHLASGRDTHLAVGQRLRAHTGQALGILAGAGQADTPAAVGLSLIAAQGPVALQALSGSAQVAATGPLTLQTARGAIQVTGGQRVVLAVAGGASITLDAGRLTVQCPGTVTVKAGRKSMLGPAAAETPPADPPPSDFCLPCFARAVKAATPLVPA